MRIGSVHSLGYKIGSSFFWGFLLLGDLGIWHGLITSADSAMVWRVIAGAVAAGGLVMFLAGLLSAWREATWLQGTALIVRSALRTRQVDLATADIDIKLPDERFRRPHYLRLNVVNATTRERIQLVLGTTDALDFSGPHLLAMADAMESGRGEIAAAQRIRGYCRSLPYARPRQLGG